MCAIFGSFNKSMFEVLYRCNSPRGAWGGSLLAVESMNISLLADEENRVSAPPLIKRWRNSIDIEKELKPSNYKVYLGHVQAPTGGNRVWSERTTHPFLAGNWIIAHNGVISNQDKLISKYNIKESILVDSMLIPLMTDKFNRELKLSNVKGLEKTLSDVEGTFSIWAYNRKTNKIYIARQGSTLFADKRGNFSSINSKNSWNEVEEGKLFELTPKGIKEVGGFTNSSPFFVL